MKTLQQTHTILLVMLISINTVTYAHPIPYSIVDTAQTDWYDNSSQIDHPLAGDSFYDQAAASGNNILLIILDDWGADSHHLYNDDPSATFAPTPNIDRLASQGVLFGQAYTYATCSPTRATMLTGRYGHRTGILSPGGAKLDRDETTIPEILKARNAGYADASFGKWHLGGHPARGPVNRGGWSYFAGSSDNLVDGSYYNWKKVKGGVVTTNHTVYATTDNVNDTIEWISGQTEPWFVWLAFNAPHSPYDLPPTNLHSYGEFEVEGNERRCFEAMVEAVDTETGRLLDFVGTNLTDTTVILMGDNGTSGGVIQPPHPKHRGKGTLYQGGIKVPLIIAGANVANPGRRSDELVHSADLFATILELAGVDLDAAMTMGVGEDSRSLLPILADQSFNPPENPIMLESDAIPGGRLGRAVLNESYKLIRIVGEGDEFYNYQNDPLEKTNLLDRVLSTEEQAAYDLLSEQAASMQHGIAVTVPYPVVDTGQTGCYDNNGGYTIPDPGPGEPFAGQDAQYAGILPAYNNNGDGTITDLKTGLMWQQTPDLTNQISFAGAFAEAEALELGGHTDWRVPTIKELYSLIKFNGVTGQNEASSIPYLDTNYFDFVYGDTDAGARHIDAQYWSATEYVGVTMNGNETVFGVNFADGRIKGYPKTQGNKTKRMFTRYVRGNPAYGINDFEDNGDSTITDHATGLMWQQGDSGAGMDWSNALAYAENLELAGYKDWRLPNAKELQSIVDYTRSPQTTQTPAIDITLFDAHEAYYWTSTTHRDGAAETRGKYAVYIAFGEALGWMGTEENPSLLDVHGAGAQRSDWKSGEPVTHWPGHGPQGDVIRIYNHVRCVRGSVQAPILDTDGDGIPDWVEYQETGTTTGYDSAGDPDNDLNRF